MDGATLAGGAVASISGFQHPIAVAREVLRDGRHVLYAADGAAAFARSRGFPAVDPASMITQGARDRLALTLRGAADGGWAGGTVGAVARDSGGHVAAATSTGGTVGKRAGRVGDSPILGAGTYADDLAGAFSGTGDGEGYLRTAIGARACFWLEQGTPVDEVARRAIVLLRERANAAGGVILVDRAGRVALARSTATMSWAAQWAGATNAFSGCLVFSALRSSAACRPIRTRPRRDIFCFDRGFASHS
jgi:beta-aspartyl-peptidase (threonine type)